MSQFGAAMIYLAAFIVYLIVSIVYVPVLVFLGIPVEVALLATGIGTLCLIGAVLAKVVTARSPAAS